MAKLKKEFVQGIHTKGADYQDRLKVWLDNLETTDTQNIAIENREELLDGLKNRYERRLTSKLQANLRYQIALKLQYTTEGTSEAFVKNFYVHKVQGLFQKQYQH